MDEDNSDDELPSISLSQDVSVREVVMPSAREVAAARARELRTELELRRLRDETHSPPPYSTAPTCTTSATEPPRSDSSGSEGEAALSAAVRALHVLPPPPGGAPAPAPHAPAARRLLALLPPSAALQPHLAAFQDHVPATVLNKHINQMVWSVSCAVSCAYNAWSADALETCGALLLAACLARPAPSHAARRALHALLSRSHPRHALAPRLAALLARAAFTCDAGVGVGAGARALLRAGECARGGPPAAELLAALLHTHALVALLAPHTRAHLEERSEPLRAEELGALVAGGWRGLPAPDRLTALRAAGRVLAGVRAGAGAGAGDALAGLHAHPPAADKHHPDHLKVVVAASTLQLLFRRAHT